MFKVGQTVRIVAGYYPDRWTGVKARVTEVDPDSQFILSTRLDYPETLTLYKNSIVIVDGSVKKPEIPEVVFRGGVKL